MDNVYFFSKENHREHQGHDRVEGCQGRDDADLSVTDRIHEAQQPEIRGVVPALLTGVMGYLGLLCFMYAIRNGKVCIVAPLTALYPVVTLVLAMIFLREKINIVQLAGIILALVSAVLISHE